MDNRVTVINTLMILNSNFLQESSEWYLKKLSFMSQKFDFDLEFKFPSRGLFIPSREGIK